MEAGDCSVALPFSDFLDGIFRGSKRRKGRGRNRLGDFPRASHPEKQGSGWVFAKGRGDCKMEIANCKGQIGDCGSTAESREALPFSDFFEGRSRARSLKLFAHQWL
jgi:hypothetical protein